MIGRLFTRSKFNRDTLPPSELEARFQPRSNAPHNSDITHESTCLLPYDIVELIIAHLAYDLNALEACSLTCRSWYLVAAPHLHYSLVLRDESFDASRCKLKPLLKVHQLGLTPLVREIRIGQLEGRDAGWFGPEAFSPNDLRYFAAFANVKTLLIAGLAIDRFMPGIEHYFGQFSPTLQSIFLSGPTCTTPGQLSHFLSLFQNLDDIHIRRFSLHNESIPDTELTPIFKPKLRGQLSLFDFPSVEALKHLIAIRGSMQFRQMVLRNIGDCSPVLLKACAKTLETLRIYVADELG